MTIVVRAGTLSRGSTIPDGQRTSTAAFFRGAEAHEKARIVRGEVTVLCPRLMVACRAVGGNIDISAESVAVGFHAAQHDAHPRRLVAAVVAQNLRRASMFVTMRSVSPSSSRSPNSAARLASTLVTIGPQDGSASAYRPPSLREELVALFVGEVVEVEGDVVHDVAVGDERVEIAVVVEIEERGAEAEKL